MVKATFWDDFSSCALLWATKMNTGKEHDVIEEIDELLKGHGLDLCFDVTIDESHCLLIFSPEGDFKAASSIDKLLEEAPSSDLWRFFGRRQQKDLDDAAAIVRHLYLQDPRFMRYHVHREIGRVLVLMWVPADIDLSPEEAQGMIDTFLWHAIGEDVVMDNHISGRVIFGVDAREVSIDARELVDSIGRGG